MNPAAIPGIRELAQVYNWFSRPSSSAIPPAKVEEAEQKRRQMPLNVHQLIRVFNFLEPEDLESLEKVSKSFKDAVWYQRKSRCENFFPGTDLDSVLPATLSFEESLQLMHKNIIDESFYKRYIGNVEPGSQSAKASFLKRYNQHDPCDPTTTIGKAYVLLYIPSHIEIDEGHFSLSGADDPNDPEAPRLIQRNPSLGVQSDSTTLKVAVTLNNIIELFKHPKTGNSSLCCYIRNSILEDHGNKRIPAGWVCMRRDVIGRNLDFAAQQALATKKGVEISELLPRILFNFMEHSRSKKVGVYPDGKAPWTFARTLTLSNGTNHYWGCGANGLSGLIVRTHRRSLAYLFIGIAVVLPAEV